MKKDEAMAWSSKRKQLILGTALWGWGVDKEEAFGMLDIFIEQGGSYVDVATNYPINKVSDDFGLALKYISDWIKSKHYLDLKIILKLGAVDNSGSGTFDLGRGTIFSSVNDSRELLGQSLYCVSVHWDNRSLSLQDQLGVCETIKAFEEIRQLGYVIGLSGIKFPEAYSYYLEDIQEDILIQVKENLLTQTLRECYEKFFPRSRYIAYGLNLGGLKCGNYLNSSSKVLRNIEHPKRLEALVKHFLTINKLVPEVKEVSDLTLYHAYCNPRLEGVIVGPRTRTQLKDTFKLWRELSSINPAYSSDELRSMVLGIF